jgi:O-antigen ligase
VGTNGFDALKQEQVARGLVSPLALHAALAHAHSQYMQNLVIRGGIGFVVLVAFLFLPLWLSMKKMGGDAACVLIPLSFAISAFSDVPFEHQDILYLYVLSMIFVWYSSEIRVNESAL